MPITKQDKHELDQIYSDWCEKYSGCKEDYFACMYPTRGQVCSSAASDL